MSSRSFEAAILNEARRVISKSALRQRDIQEWSSAEIGPHDGERVFWLPMNRVWISIKETDLPKRSQSAKAKDHG